MALFLLVALFIGLILLLLLAIWIYQLLDRSGVFGYTPKYRRFGAVLFVFLPVLCGLVLFPTVILLTYPSVAGAPAIPFPNPFGQEASGKIVYTCQVFRDMERDQICLINPDGSGQRRLTQNDLGDFNFPALSPDGRSVVFVGREVQNYEIYEMDLEGGTRRLTENAGNHSAPAISPDGRSIVFARAGESGQAIWIMDRDGSNPFQVFGPPDGNGWDPVWSPDGMQILFASDREGDVQLYRMEADGSNLRRISRLEGIRGRSDWSPSEQIIATYAGSSWEREIFLMDLEGSNLRQITEGGNNLAPSFSPDGSWITFTSYRDLYQDENGCEIYIMRLDGSELRRLTENDYCDWQPRWGP